MATVGPFAIPPPPASHLFEKQKAKGKKRKLTAWYEFSRLTLRRNSKTQTTISK